MKNCCIVFDVDGTLFDTKNGIIKTLNYVLKEFGKDAIDPQDEDKYIGPPIKKSLMKYQCMEDMEADEATILYRRNYVECYFGNFYYEDYATVGGIAYRLQV